MSTTNKYAAPALERGLDILEYLVTQEQPRSQTEIAIGIGRKPNDIYRVLVGLEARGYLLRDEHSGRYRLSFKLYNLSRSISPIDKMRQCALPYMEDLAVDIGQSCYLAMLYQSQTMIIVHARGHSPISLNISEGALFPTSTSTAGKVLLANSNNKVRNMILQRDNAYTALAKPQQTALLAELNNTKDKGYLSAASPFIEGTTDFAALIGVPEGKVIAALAISSLKSNWGSATPAEELREKVIATAQHITQQLGSL
ncbi:IclR family transcriptional regulator C-terminal domain-containing protein [Saccharophagus degradans]|uniref:IclR family transcriptional regulator n=1 Tax=Saccharophagus degradans TaxID=86304 RepID=UPI002477CF84|nr:IclR family transcriptional regulator C-terminal domain-containing protein [Saccharophagus degradans]WGO97287.1 IclR family transcriptional regulator C-terminal domain-containing protein [Saccharophagus degradans]